MEQKCHHLITEQASDDSAANPIQRAARSITREAPKTDTQVAQVWWPAATTGKTRLIPIQLTRWSLTLLAGCYQPPILLVSLKQKHVSFPQSNHTLRGKHTSIMQRCLIIFYAPLCWEYMCHEKAIKPNTFSTASRQNVMFQHLQRASDGKTKHITYHKLHNILIHGVNLLWVCVESNLIWPRAKISQFKKLARL